MWVKSAKHKSVILVRQIIDMLRIHFLFYQLLSHPMKTTFHFLDGFDLTRVLCNNREGKHHVYVKHQTGLCTT